MTGARQDAGRRLEHEARPSRFGRERGGVLDPLLDFRLGAAESSDGRREMEGVGSAPAKS